jgi:hypothetical protein
MDLTGYLAISAIAILWLAAEVLAWYRWEQRRH